MTSEIATWVSVLQSIREMSGKFPVLESGHPDEVSNRFQQVTDLVADLVSRLFPAQNVAGDLVFSMF